ncbi:hypothetical protein AAFN86_04430 [Roseomonas sp. CAU 1739]|uniref:hypothetical protein n=1 Tax=Roseomonas sp. CAU 1739 TaxID=3140364 RepID=UPI00325AE8EB
MREIVILRIRGAMLAGLSGLLAFGVAVFGVPIFITWTRTDGAGCGHHPSPCASPRDADGRFAIDPERRLITDHLGRSGMLEAHAPGTLARGGRPFGLVLEDFTAARRSQGRITSWIACACATPWSGARPMRRPVLVLPLLILTDTDAILATRR